MTQKDSSYKIHWSNSYYSKKTYGKKNTVYKRGLFYNKLGIVDVFASDEYISMTIICNGIQHNRHLTEVNTSDRSLSVRAGKFLREINSKE